MDPTIDEIRDTDEIKEYDTEQLVAYLKSVKTLKLDEDDLSILRNEEYTGGNFLKITREELRVAGMRLGPSTLLAEFAKTCSEKPERQNYSSIRSLKDVLKDYNIYSDDISEISRFEPQIHDFRDDNEYFQNCISNILIRIKSYGYLYVNSNEKIQREYVSTILHAALRIAEAGSDKKFKMDVEYEVNGKKYYGLTDYAITESKFGNLICTCITEDSKIDRSIQEGIAQNIRQLESSHDVNKKKRKRGEDGEFDYLYGIIAGLLLDKVDDSEPETKRRK
ncbi:25875_t:CDS:1, partial [Gigaspora rosea]